MYTIEFSNPLGRVITVNSELDISGIIEMHVDGMSWYSPNDELTISILTGLSVAELDMLCRSPEYKTEATRLLSTCEYKNADSIEALGFIQERRILLSKRDIEEASIVRTSKLQDQVRELERQLAEAQAQQGGSK